MEKLLEKLKEYLHMETEIPFEEFSDYYRQLISELSTTFNNLDRIYPEDTFCTHFFKCFGINFTCFGSAICIRLNNGANIECFNSVVLIKFNLGKDGMSAEEIEKATDEINNSI